MESKIEHNICQFQSSKPVPHILLWLHRVEGKGEKMFLVMRTLRFYSPTFLMGHISVVALVILLYITSPALIYLITGSLYCLMHTYFNTSGCNTSQLILLQAVLNLRFSNVFELQVRIFSIRLFREANSLVTSNLVLTP